MNASDIIEAITLTLEENAHLADGDVCTLSRLKIALPTEVGLYRHRWDFRGQMREQVLFVGYTNARAPRLQGSEPNAYMPRKLKCCKPDEHLHADRLTPKEWGGWWARIETPNA